MKQSNEMEIKTTAVVEFHRRRRRSVHNFPTFQKSTVKKSLYTHSN